MEAEVGKRGEAAAGCIALAEPAHDALAEVVFCCFSAADLALYQPLLADA